MKYGIRRLIVINSGQFLMADFDLSHPIHLSAPNNRGKSTLVNALQFFYVDDIRKMHFGKRTPEDTKNHYFGQEPSYLVFECATASGTQSLLVAGRGALQGGKFERYVYSGGFAKEDYVDADGTIRSFEALKTRLAGKELVAVQPAQLWEVLSGRTNSKGRELPRLSILPVRTQEEYRSFREIFVSLLRLKNSDARSLRRLIIACHARDLGDKKLDVAALYRDQFEQATRSEEELQFIRRIGDHIDRGRALRTEIAEATACLRASAASLWEDASSCNIALTEWIGHADQKRQGLETERQDVDRGRSELHQACGAMQNQAKLLQEKLQKLQAEHDHWKSYSPQMIQALRDNAADLEGEVSRLREHLRQAARLNVAAMRKEVAELQRELSQGRIQLDNFGRTAAATLIKAGMAPGELDLAFRALNPNTLNLIVDQQVEFRALPRVVQRLQTIAKLSVDLIYDDGDMRADLHSITGPDMELLQEEPALRHRLTLLDERLREASQQLRVAEEMEEARKMLTAKEQDLGRRRGELSDYDRYCLGWAERGQLEQELEHLTQQQTELTGRIRKLDQRLDEILKAATDIYKQRSRIDAHKQAMHDNLTSFRDAAGAIGTELNTRAPEFQRVELDGVDAAATEVLARLGEWMQGHRGLKSRADELRSLEGKIQKASAETRTQQVYFDDSEMVWDELFQKRESMPEREHVVRTQWDHLFTMLTSNFQLMLTGLRNVESAVRSLNHGMKSYKVSNLKAVEISVEKVHATCGPLETLTSKDTIFADAEAIDVAKRRLQGMIEGRQVIELENLFEIRIRVQENDGRWNDAKSLDDIGSTGTGMTAKAMVFIQLIRAIVGSSDVALHFYLDETGQLDDENLKATTAMAVSRGMVPITAQPGVRMESLAHPVVTVYTLGLNAGRFQIDGYQTYHARRDGEAVTEAGGKNDEN